jgi:hypothetical protein
MYDYYMEWLWDRRNKMYHNKMPSEFPTLMWPEGYQKVLLEFSAEPSREQLQIAGNISRELFLGENLFKKFTTLQSDIRNNYNPFWATVNRSGLSTEEKFNIAIESVLNWHRNKKEEDNHKQRVRTIETTTGYKRLLHEEDKKAYITRQSQVSLESKRDFPGAAHYCPNDLIVFKLLGLPAREHCLKALDTPLKSTGPLPAVQDLTQEDYEKTMKANGISRAKANGSECTEPKTWCWRRFRC